MKNIIRVRKKENPFIMLDKTCINDDRLSWSAKGLHTYLLGLPDNWVIYVSELVNHTSAGRDHTYTVIRELIKFGYMQRFEYRYKGKIVDSSYFVYETPVDVGPLSKSMATIVKVTKNENGEYIPIENDDETIEKTTCEPLPETTDSDKSDMVDTKLLNNNNNKYINILNNEEVVVVNEEKDKEEKVINLYKSMKAEKRVMPHTIKLIKSYIDKFDYEVFEEVFISGTGSNVDNFYKYIKQVFLELDKKNIKTIKDYELDNENFRNKKRPSKKLDSRNCNNSIPQNKTKFHNFSGSENFKKYNADELERILLESQKDKFNKN